MVGQVLKTNLISRLSVTFGEYTQQSEMINIKWAKLSPCQYSGPKLALGLPNLSMTKYQYQNFTSPDIKESVVFFLNPV